jgi:hypothetical protein
MQKKTFQAFSGSSLTAIAALLIKNEQPLYGLVTIQCT